jgi:cell division septal protein FtsQ
MKRNPRARKARAAARVWSRRLAVGTGALALVATASWAAWARAWPYVTGHDYFRLRSIRIASDETRVAPETLAEIAGLYEDSSLWSVDPEAITSTLRDASWVKQARVSRHFPWQVNLTVSRRHAVAAAVAGSKAFLVDADGVLFHEVEQASIPDLPYLTGWDTSDAQAENAVRLRKLLEVLGEASNRQIEVSELHLDEGGAVWLYATGIKASVRLGKPENAQSGLDKLSIALAELGPLADRARVIDTDYPGRIVVRGADDKLPAMLAAHTEKAIAQRNAQPVSSMLAGEQDTPEASAPARTTDTQQHKAARRG